MGKFGEIWRRLGMLAHGEKFARELEEEMRGHREMKEQELREAGVSEDEARHEANRAFGNAMRLREKSREGWGWQWLEDGSKDLRFGARMLRKNPGFTTVAVLTLALGIGVNTAIFTLVHAVMLKALPVAHPEQLYNLGNDQNCCVMSGLNRNTTLYSAPLYEHLRDHTTEFEQIAALSSGLGSFSARRSGNGQTSVSMTGEFVSGNYFETLDSGIAAGRPLYPSDDKPGAPSAAVISYRAWAKMFGSDPAIVGEALTINSMPVTIVGVTPQGFFGDTLRSDPADLWLPLASEPALKGSSSISAHPELFWLYAIGRIREGVSREQAQTHLTTELQAWLSGHPEAAGADRGLIGTTSISLVPGRGGINRTAPRYREGLAILALVSGLVLLIACANIANMLLARRAAERQQIAVRAALGASRRRLVQQTLAESLLLGVLGGALGVAVAFAGARLILALAFRGSEYVPIDAWPSIPVLAFALGASLLTGILFAVTPAWIACKADPIEALRGAGRSTNRSSTMMRKGLVVFQAALSMVLLTGAGLLTLNLRKLEGQRFGFETTGRLIVKINPQEADYKPEQLEDLYRRIEQRLRAIPGVRSVGLSLYSPMADDNWSDPIFFEGRPVPSRPEDKAYASFVRVSAHYFETVGTRLAAGRWFDEHDLPNAKHVAVINKRFAAAYYTKENPMGKHIGLGEPEHSGDYEIVGIVEDTKYQDAYGPAYPTVFLPFFQMEQYKHPAMQSVEVRSNYAGDIEVWASGRLGDVAGQTRSELAALDANLTVAKIIRFSEQVSLNFNQERLTSTLTGMFGLLALVLACVGLYGVTAYGVAQQTAEIGVRMAMGANRQTVVTMVIKGAIAQIGIGLGIGLPLALAAGHALSSQLFGVRGYDPMVLGGAALALGLAALAAGLVPALRAASIDPMKALRME